MCGNIKELLFIKLTLYLYVPLFWKQILTKQNIASTKNSQEFFASPVPVLKRNKATNFSTSTEPSIFSTAMKSLEFGNLFKLLRLSITFAWEVYTPGKKDEDQYDNRLILLKLFIC